MTGARPTRLPMAYRLAAFLLRPLLMALTRRDWSGIEHLPARGGFVVSPNHISYADPLIFAHFMYDSGREGYFLAKQSLFEIPVVGFVIRKAGQIPVYRNSMAAAEAYRAAVAAVREGKAVAIFPEGTITRDPGSLAHAGQDRCGPHRPRDAVPAHPGRAVGSRRRSCHPMATGPGSSRARRCTCGPWPAVDLCDLYGKPIDAKTLREPPNA